MISLEDKNTIFFDVDDTLVMWDFGKYPNSQNKKIEFIKHGYSTNYLIPHTKHIQALKDHYINGHIVVVWSAGGAEWAKCVVLGLGLESFVHLTMSKPTWYYDDLNPLDFMPLINRVYYEHLDESEKKIVD